MGVRHYEVINYDLGKFDFPNLYAKKMGVEDLTNLYSGLDDSPQREKNSVYKNMEQTDIYQRLFKNLHGDDDFARLYQKFIAEVIQPLFKEPIFYQARPSHRIHFIDSRGQLRFHKDMDYGHREEEINFTVPMTPTFDTNSIFIESAPGKQDFIPMELKPGQAARFKGSTHTHGARNNQTKNSRVSFDFRVVPFYGAPEELRKTDTTKSSSSTDFQEALKSNPHHFVLFSPG